jgi:hypothetical protein
LFLVLFEIPECGRRGSTKIHEDEEKAEFES